MIFSPKNVKQGHKPKLTYLYSCWILYMRHHLQYENGMPKVALNGFNIGEAWNPVYCHGNKTVKLKLRNTFSRILLRRIKHFWCKLAEIYFLFLRTSLICFRIQAGFWLITARNSTSVCYKQPFYLIRLQLRTFATTCARNTRSPTSFQR